MKSHIITALIFWLSMNCSMSQDKALVDFSLLCNKKEYYDIYTERWDSVIVLNSSGELSCAKLRQVNEKSGDTTFLKVYSDDKILIKGQLLNGIAFGDFFYYYPMKNKLMYVIGINDNMKDGRIIEFLPNGGRSEGYYKDDFKHGIFISIDENNNYLSKIFYDKGVEIWKILYSYREDYYIEFIYLTGKHQETNYYNKSTRLKLRTNK